MSEQALLMMAPGESSQASNLAKLLSFFGVSWRNLTLDEFFTQIHEADKNRCEVRLFCSADTFLGVIDRLGQNVECVRLWTKLVHSAFVFPVDKPESLQNVARRVSRDDGAVVSEMNPRAGDLRVSDQWTDFCAAMGGVRVVASGSDLQASVVFNASKHGARNIISAGGGATFLTMEYAGVTVFLSTSANIIDIESELTSQSFDVREHFLSAVPVVLYIKWAFAETCWNSPEACASLVVDDPLLKPSYGCLNFEELLALMERHRFATNIAFIPWNWRRSNPDVARLFTQRPEHYSLSIHGFDHVAAEFGSRDREHLYWRIKRAVARMSEHESRTGICHDRVMVFPQGVFSEAAMDALKRSNLTAAVNTDVVSVDPHPPAIRISDVWDVAVMRYSSFPIFTRRHPAQEIANFAFDILLGKPCIIGIHHDFCRDRYKHLLEFINRLNAVPVRLSWRSLGEVVRRSCRQRQLSPGLVEIEMYGSELRVKNDSGRRQRYTIRRCESDPSDIKDVRADSGHLPWNFSDGYVRFESELEPDRETTIRIQFRDLVGNGAGKENLGYRVKTRLRRYLSEVRDNYIMKNNFAGSRFSE